MEALSGPGYQPRAPRRKLPDYQGEQAVQVAPAAYVTVGLAAAITGFSDKAIRRKIEDGKWVEGVQWLRSPDGTILISMKGYQAWVEQAPAMRRAAPASA